MTSTGLIGHAEHLRSEIEALRQLRASATVTDAVRTRAQQLQDRAGGLAADVERVALFRSRGCTPSLPMESLQDLLTRTRDYRTGFAAERASIIADPENSDFKWKYLERFPQITRSIRASLARAWERHVDDLAPDISDDLLGAFAGVPEFGETVRQIREIRGQLTALRGNPPDRPEAFDEVDVLARGARQRWQSIADQDPSPAVRAFLTDAAGQGASLDALNKEVRDWLEARGLAGSLRLVWKRPV